MPEMDVDFCAIRVVSDIALLGRTCTDQTTARRPIAAAEVTAQLNAVRLATSNELNPALASAQQRVLASESW